MGRINVNQSEASSFNIVPFSPEEIQSLLSKAPFQWWITGGWALDLFMGVTSRPHFDIDVAIARKDQTAAREYLNSWDFQYAVPGTTNPVVFAPWNPREILEFRIHGSWARENATAPWRFEFLLHEIEEGIWRFRYCQKVQHPASSIGGRIRQAIFYLQPEIALLYKAARMREVDEQDFRRVLPRLSGTQRAQLREDIVVFAPGHAWLGVLG